MTDKVAITCALTGVLTNPKQHPVPVTVQEMAQAAKDAFDAGASIMHVHFRNQTPGLGHLPTWEPEICGEIVDAIRDACPGVIINMSTGVVGPDISGPVNAMKRVKPEIAACNAGSLNYLKVRANGQWAWPPMLFDNPVSKIEKFLEAMKEVGAMPEFECFDVGIVRSIDLFVKAGLTDHPDYNFVMGVASGMPIDTRLLELLCEYRRPGTTFQVTAIGRAEVWPLHQRAAELGGQLRSGVEDTFYLPNGEVTTGNGPLIEELVKCARNAGREVATPDEARAIFGLRPRA
ncbi:MAG: 3-keto-5-aminohexanoate cleavage protein [Myxococcales bacterium]|jgi:3-keto-5-aminohexanoate cleavage enzyme|nr:3-keto-5-aminohexanoate cleavage protein [Myxococcales bacterium]